MSWQRSKAHSSGGEIQGIKDGVCPSDTGWRCHGVIKDRRKWMCGVSGAKHVEAALDPIRSGWTEHLVRRCMIFLGERWRIPDPPLWFGQLHYASQRNSASAKWARHGVSRDQGLIKAGSLRLVEVPIMGERLNVCVVRASLSEQGVRKTKDRN